MAVPLVANGAFAKVNVDGETIGFATNAGFDENFNVQPLEVLNFLGPVSYESLGYSCTIDVGLFIGRNRENVDRIINGFKLVPVRSEVKDAGFMVDRIITFLDTRDKRILNSFRGAVLNANNSVIAPNTFIQKALQFMSLERVK